MKYILQVLLPLLLFFSACTSYESLLNYNQSPGIPTDPQTITNFMPLVIQNNDILSVKISSTDPIAVQPFLMAGVEKGGAGGGANEFLVNSEGIIDFPTVGKIMVKGLKIEEAKELIQEKLSPYFQQSPIIQVRLVNFRVNVNGEVGRPGSFQVNNDRLTIIEALTLAGDFTPYSSRDSILIIREEDGMRNFGYVSFNSYDLFTSPYFYLQQNDVIYVRPDKTKVNAVRDPASRFVPWISAGVSLVTLLITITR